MRVDFPAPLSPSRPRTSPLRRWMLMFRSAIVGPNRLATFSTRMTSSSVGVSVSMTRVFGMSEPSAKTGPRSDAGDVDVDRHRDEDREADVEELVVRAHALEDEPVVDDAQEQRADERADDRSVAADEQRAADDGRGDRLEEELVRGRRVRRDVADANRIEEPGEAGEQGAQREVANDVRLLVDPRLLRAEPVAADRHRVDPPSRPAERDLQDDHDSQRPEELRVGPAAKDRLERPSAQDRDARSVDLSRARDD